MKEKGVELQYFLITALLRCDIITVANQYCNYSLPQTTHASAKIMCTILSPDQTQPSKTTLQVLYKC